MAVAYFSSLEQAETLDVAFLKVISPFAYRLIQGSPVRVVLSYPKPRSTLLKHPRPPHKLLERFRANRGVLSYRVVLLRSPFKFLLLPSWRIFPF